MADNTKYGSPMLTPSTTRIRSNGNSTWIGFQLEPGRMVECETIAGILMNLDRTRLDEAMTRDPVTLPADSNVAYALNLMVLEGFRHIPMVDDDDRPVAVVSMRDLIEYLGSFYSRDLLTIAPHPRLAGFKQRDGA